MTDSNLVREELMSLMGITQEEAEEYDGLIEYTVNCINPFIKNEDNENDIRIVYLCAVKVYYKIVLLQSDSVSSFSAGEVSFTLDTSAAEGARALLDDAESACVELIDYGGFVFKAV